MRPHPCAIIGSIIFKIMYDWLAAITPQYWQFWLGLVLVAVVLFGKGGILGFVESGREWLAARFGKGGGK